MIGKLLQKIKSATGLKTLGIHKLVKKSGCEVSSQALYYYQRPEAHSIRLDILCGLRKASGKNWAEFGRWIDDATRD